MITAFARAARAEIQEEIDAVTEAIVSGNNIKTLEDYRSLTGRKLGLEKALAVLDDIEKRFDEQD